jgi:phage portal protein BeeE
MSLLQTLAAAFKGGGGRVPLARAYVSPWYAADSLAYDDPSAVKRAYLDNPVAQRAVRLVAEGIAGAPLLPTDPALAALIAATSAGQSLIETLASHLLLHGNAYVQVMKDARGLPVELFALRPERMQVIAGADGWPTGFSYRVGEKALTIPLEAEDGSPNLIHIRHFHPGGAMRAAT